LRRSDISCKNLLFTSLSSSLEEFHKDIIAAVYKTLSLFKINKFLKVLLILFVFILKFRKCLYI